jgi:hypothetical protein
MRQAPRQGATGWRRLLWFAVIYAVSIVGFAALVYGLRALVPRS